MQHEIAHLRQHVEFLKKLQRQATGTSGDSDDYDAKPKICVDSRDSSYR